VAQRRGSGDSYIIRFALKTMVERFAPPCAQDLSGRALRPVRIEPGGDFFSHVDPDKARLHEIVNKGLSGPLGRCLYSKYRDYELNTDAASE
jgi:hypothetical protein